MENDLKNDYNTCNLQARRSLAFLQVADPSELSNQK